MNQFTLKGKVLGIFPKQQITDKFSKREFILEVNDGKYSQEIKIQTTNVNMDKLKGIKKNDEVEAKCSLRGRPHGEGKEKRWFVNVEAWDIQKIEEPSGLGEDDDSDDLPF